MRRPFFALAISVLAVALFSAGAVAAPFAYITNGQDDTVSVIDTATMTVVGAPIPVGDRPYGVTVNAAGTRVYVANYSGTVSVIDATTNTVAGAPIRIDSPPAVNAQVNGIAVDRAGTRVYVTANLSTQVTGAVFAIDTTTNAVIGAPIPVGKDPIGIAVTPSGDRVYVANTNFTSNSVSVINTATNTVIKTIPVGRNPFGVAVHPAGTRVYVTNFGDGTISVIDTGTDTVIGTIQIGPDQFFFPIGIAVASDGTRIYVAGHVAAAVVDTTTNTVIGTPIPVPTLSYHHGIAVTPDGSRVYVGSERGNGVAVIDAGTLAVVGTVLVGNSPYAFGQFIGPADVAVSTPSTLPTLNEWGLLLMIPLLGVAGATYAERRGRAKSPPI